MDKRTAIARLREAAPELRRRYGVVSAALFGSQARGDADALSDIDIAVRFAPGRGEDVMALCGVSGYLTGLLGIDVDVVSLPAGNQDLAAAIEREAELAF